MKHILKHQLIVTVLLIFFGCISSYSQVSEIMTNDYTSPSKDFLVTVKGLAYNEGYTGKQEITLKNRDDHILWQKNESIWSPPIVSDLGIVALLGSGTIRFFDSTGKALGSYKPNDSLEQFRTECADCYADLKYSPDGKYYYIILDCRGIPYILSLANDGKERWRFPLTKLKDGFNGISIHVFNGGLLASFGAMYNWNVCYLLNDSGIVVNSYKSRSRVFLNPVLDIMKNEFTLNEDNVLITYDLTSGSYLRSKPFIGKSSRKHIK